MVLGWLLVWTVSAFGFHSPEGVGLEATIPDGKLVTSAPEAQWTQEIRNQLRYFIAYTFSHGSPALGQTLQVRILGSRPLERGRREVRYDAKFVLAWETGGSPPSVLVRHFPVGGDRSSLDRFDRAYGGRCGDGSSPLWYSMPQAQDPRCPLSASKAPAYAVTLRADLAPSSLQSHGKAPEYEKIFEDGRLVVTFLGGNEQSRTGQAEELLGRLDSQFGSPVALKKQDQGNYVRWEGRYDTFGGPLEVRLYDLVRGNVQGQSSQFRQQFAADTTSSDLVAYNGHSDYGANLRAFTALGRFQRGRYYLYWVNACKPFAHLDDTLTRGAASANPGEPADRYVDVMSVVNVGDFSYGNDVYQLILGLLVKRPYSSLLLWLSAGQPAVLGEQDNAWPDPFPRFSLLDRR